MKYYHRTDIFICESLKAQEKIYGKIIDYLQFNEEDKNTCRVIGKNELFEKIKDPQYKELRFACITRKTSSYIPCELFNRGIPMLFLILAVPNFSRNLERLNHWTKAISNV